MRIKAGWPGMGAIACGAAMLFVLLWHLTGDKEAEPKVAYAASRERTLTHPDAVCRSCHQAIYDRYEKTPMARGSGLAVDGLDAAELSAAGFDHRPSGVAYRVSVRDGEAYLGYHRAAGVGGVSAATGAAAALDGERRLEYFIGSGRRGRTFLYEEENFWFEAPINWYGKKQLWDMAPAYGDAHSMPNPLPVDPNCLHCHTGDAQPSTGAARNHYPEEPFRSGGVGCAACHGDPAAHLAGVVRGRSGEQAKAGPIVNPDNLSPVRRDSTCLQCHLEGDAAVYRPGRSLAAFRAGDDLSQSVVYFVDSKRAAQGLRASSQYEALLRSACKRGAGDRLTCTTCHDPHGSPTPEERVSFFRARCLNCHTGERIATQHHPEQQDCAVCHMPTRKTLDISHEQLTDHDIEARPLSSEALMQTRLAAPELVPVGKTMASDRELGLAYAQLAQRGDKVSGERALALLSKAVRNGSDDAEVHDQLGFLLQISGSRGPAAEQYLAALRERPQDTTAEANLAVLYAAKGQVREAINLLAEVVRSDPSQTAAGLNLAFLQCRSGEIPEARRTIERVLAFHPDSPEARQMMDTGRYGSERCLLR